jgi:isobutyryl-CoA mutase
MARSLPPVDVRRSSGIRQVVPSERIRYLAEITETLHSYHAQTDRQSDAARRVQRLEAAERELASAGHDTSGVEDLLDAARRELPDEIADQTAGWPAVVESYSCDEQVVTVRDRETHTKLTRESLSGNRIPRVGLPRYADHGELVRFWRRENLPGCFPFTAGVFPFKREGEDPARMFAEEGDPSRTNRRFACPAGPTSQWAPAGAAASFSASATPTWSVCFGTSLKYQ